MSVSELDGLKVIDETPEARVSELRVYVAAMRELGVLEWLNIRLGPAPLQPEPEKPKPDHGAGVTRASVREFMMRGSGGPVKRAG